MRLVATKDRTEHEKMLAGDLFLSPDPELIAIGNRARQRTLALNATPREQAPERIAILKSLFGRFGRSWIESPFSVDYGVNVEIGDFSFVNMNCTFLDCARITIGNRTAIGPGVHLVTASHPIDPLERTIPYPADREMPFRAVGYAEPIVIGDDVWIGAGAIVLPGVTIGSGAVIGAGSVVTRSIPPNAVAYGNPCRVARYLDGRPADPASTFDFAD